MKEAEVEELVVTDSVVEADPDLEAELALVGAMVVVDTSVGVAVDEIVTIGVVSVSDSEADVEAEDSIASEAYVEVGDSVPVSEADV